MSTLIRFVFAIAAASLLSACSTSPRALDLRYAAPSSSMSAGQARVLISTWLAGAPGRSWTTFTESGSMRPMLAAHHIALLEPYTGGSIPAGQLLSLDTLTLRPRMTKLVLHRALITEPAIGSGLAPKRVLTSGIGPENYRSDGWTPTDRVYWRVAAVLYLSPEEIENFRPVER